MEAHDDYAHVNGVNNSNITVEEALRKIERRKDCLASSQHLRRMKKEGVCFDFFLSLK